MVYLEGISCIHIAVFQYLLRQMNVEDNPRTPMSFARSVITNMTHLVNGIGDRDIQSITIWLVTFLAKFPILIVVVFYGGFRA